ncbi:TadE/TadG family type IV pilus assembly protein [Ruania albidiflava]|uniref:TadE/TadG family type IV pilus assembly protein n=1 Tax=Ruania albidiflava TaxID=366586 RepID=UPI0003B561D4|nr:TadE/TadG family type IV pilus assembly protein [Ruania albidiflava]
MKLLRRLRVRLSRCGPGESGSAVVEFLGVGLVLLVPVVYLIITLGRVEAATFAADGAARDAGRLIAQADTFDQGLAEAALAVELAFADQGLDVDGGRVLQVTCEEDPCLSPGAYLHLEVATDVPLPLVPPFLDEALGTTVHVQAQAMTAVDDFREAP